MTDLKKEISYDEKYIAAIDLGSSKIGVCVALVQGRDIRIVYYKETPSAGIQASAIYIPQRAAGVIRKAIKEAEDELLIEIKQVIVGMPRNDVVQVEASASIPREHPEEYITSDEVQYIKDLALETYPLPFPDKQAIYGAVAQSFTIEDGVQLVEKDVVGTLSSTLDGNFKVFVGRKKAHDSLDRIFGGLKIDVVKRYFIPEVTAEAVLNKEELKNGVALVDIGAGVTSVAVYRGGIMQYYASIPFGGASVTGDIETECSIDEELAERIKKRFGACMPDQLGENKEKVLELRLSDPYVQIPLRYISEIITARYKEIIEAVLYHVQESGLAQQLRGGIVLTGGGALQKNLDKMVKGLSGYNVRRGYPKHRISAPAGSSAYTPSATAAIGMIITAEKDGVPDCCTALPKKETEQEPEVTVLSTAPSEPPADGQLIDPDQFGKVDPPTQTTTVTIKKGRGRKKGRDKDGEENPEEETQEKQGVIEMIWEVKVKPALMKWYDEANK